MEGINIRCPKCSWEPREHSKWRCSCGHVWNTFDTGGRCPACKMVWEDTQCIDYEGGCREWSPHLDWYDGLEEIVQKLKEELAMEWAKEKVLVEYL